MEKPKLGEKYWYIEANPDDSWGIYLRENVLGDMDKYNFACGNFYKNKEAAEADAFEMLMRLTLLDADEVGRLILNYKD